MGRSLCPVTVHGIGFQQPPEDGRPGYADALHAHLHEQLGEELGDDPARVGDSGPVYVASEVCGSRRDFWMTSASQPAAISTSSILYRTSTSTSVDWREPARRSWGVSNG